MNERLKRIALIAGFILVVVFIGWLLWFVFFRSRAPQEVSPPISRPSAPELTVPSAGEALVRPPVTPEGAAPALPTIPSVSPVAQGGVTAVTPLTLTATRAPSLARDGNSVNYYDPADGKFYAVDAKGTVRSLLNKPLLNAKTIVWSAKTERAIAEFPDGANVSVDFNTQEVVPLPAHWEDFDFAPNGEQIAAKSIGVDPSNRWLVIADPVGAGAQTVAALGNNAAKVQVNWSPNNQVIAFSDTGTTLSGFGRKHIIPIGKQQENLPGLVVEGFSFDAEWSPRGQQILYSTAGPSSNYQPSVWLVDGEVNTLGQNRRSLPLNTWADKCTYAEEGVAYCAVPQKLPAGSGLQRQLALGQPDSVYRVDTRTGAIALVAVPESGMPMTNLSVSDDGTTLFFQHELNGTLSSMRLK